VPLSEHEQRLLEQIERALYAEDPKFAARYSQTGARSRFRRRLFLAALGIVLGMVVVILGVRANMIWLGVAGFVIMLLALGWMLSRMPSSASQGNGSTPKTRKQRRSHRPVRQRFEDRWRRRWEERGE
jgi:hypothetical protein